MLRHIALWCGLAGAATAAPLQITWQITTHGTGPGYEMKTATGEHKLESFGTCTECENDAAAGGTLCISPKPGSRLYADCPGVALTPVGEDNVFITYAGGPSYIGKNRWYYISLTGGPQAGLDDGCGQASECTFSGRIPYSGSFRVGVDMTVIRGNCSTFKCGPPGCNLGMSGDDRCCGKAGDFFSITVAYKHFSATAAKTCTQSGTDTVESNSTWKWVASATCMSAPDTATAWVGSVSLTGSETGTKIEYAMTTENPGSSSTPYPNGPHLWVKVEPGCSTCQSPVAGVDVQCQNDGKWKDDLIDSSSLTIGAKGCFLTCVATAMDVTPADANAALSEAGLIEEDALLDETDTEDFFDITGMAYAGDFPEDEGKIIEALCAGNVVIANVPSSSTCKRHFVLVTGQVYDPILKKCRFQVLDPNCKNPKQYLDQLTGKPSCTAQDKTRYLVVYCPGGCIEIVPSP